MNQTTTQPTTKNLWRLTTTPELKRTGAGVAVCRFMVATDSDRGQTPVVKPVYVLGKPTVRPSEDLAIRCTHLGVGDLIEVSGVERQRIRRKRGVRFPETAIQAEQIVLRAWGPGRGAGA
jgi:hypothetical protein